MTTFTLNPVEVSGSIIQIAPRAIAVKAANLQNWVLHLGADTKLKITGTAERGMITEGTCVRFTAEIDKRTGRAKEKIDKLTIFTETQGIPERTLGVERVKVPPQAEQKAGEAAAPPPAQAAAPPAHAAPPAKEEPVDLRLED